MHGTVRRDLFYLFAPFVGTLQHGRFKTFHKSHSFSKISANYATERKRQAFHLSWRMGPGDSLTVRPLSIGRNDHPNKRVSPAARGRPIANTIIALCRYRGFDFLRTMVAIPYSKIHTCRPSRFLVQIGNTSIINAVGRSNGETGDLGGPHPPCACSARATVD